MESINMNLETTIRRLEIVEDKIKDSESIFRKYDLNIRALFHRKEKKATLPPTQAEGTN
jgi:hypothetical protein